MVNEEENGAAAAETANGGTDHDSAAAGAKKKRGAGADWAKTKDDVSLGSGDEEDDEGMGSGEFRRADAETLSKRRIVKARRPPSMEGQSSGAGEEEDKPAAANPFASISLTAPKPPSPASSSGGGGGGAAVFGSGFPKVNAASILAGGGGGGGWGSAATDKGEGEMVRPGAGPGLGSAPFGFAAYKLNPFQAAAAPSSSSFVLSPSKRKPPSELVGMAEGGGGSQFGKAAATADEEGGEEDGSPAGEEDLEAEPNVTFDVPKVQGLKDASYKPLTGEEDETCALQLRAKLYRLTEIKPKDEGAGGGGGGSSSSAPPRRDWVETGVGQAKVLVPSARTTTATAPARVVMRREPGTSVLINTLLKEPVGVAKHADKALRLTCLDESGQPSTFLFRFKTTDEMEQMLGEVENQLRQAAGGAEGAGGDV